MNSKIHIFFDKSYSYLNSEHSAASKFFEGNLKEFLLFFEGNFGEKRKK